jgi:1-acyl-sn-glycerol-3-phosphate acyltransferase
MFYRLSFLACLVIWKILFRQSFAGRDQLPGSGGMILASNHASFIDPVCAGLGLPRRDLNFLARSTLLKIPLLGWWMRRAHVIAINRGEADRGALANAVETVKSGQALLMFPEGTRSRDGELGAARPGCGFVAWHSKATVIPAYIDGSARAMPRGAWFIRPRKIRTRYGPPVSLDDLYAKPSGRETYLAISQRIMEAIGRLESGPRR